jgi:hypothetical protein
VELGTLTSTANSGDIAGTIPAGTVSGTGYRIRVISSNPSSNATDNGTNLTINLPTASVSPTAVQNINAGVNGTQLTVSEAPTAASRYWAVSTVSGSGYVSTGVTTTTYTPNFTAQGTYYIVAVSNFACTTITTNEVEVNVSPTLSTGTIGGSPFCSTQTSGSPVTVPFTSAGTFGVTNVYTAWLSNSAGSFAGAVSIGTLTSTANSDDISATIPAATATGGGYRIRVTSSDPALTASDNGSNLTINLRTNSIAPVGTQNINAGANGTQLTVTESAASTTRVWAYSSTSGGPYTNTASTGTTYTPNFAAQGTYYVVCISTWNCGSVTTSQVQVNVTATLATGTPAGSPFCAGSVISVPFTSSGSFSGNTYTAQLSNSVGSFASPVSIGTLTSDANSGSISATMPAATATGSGYLVRVISSNPAVTGSNSSAITVNESPLTTGVSVCPGGTGNLISTTICPDATGSLSKYAGLGATGGGAGSSWSNADVLDDDDANVANVNLNGGNDAENLNATNFDFSSIPSGATITGITVAINRYGSAINWGIRDVTVRLLKAGVATGDNRAITGTDWPTSTSTVQSYTGSTNALWGASWTLADITNSGFGVTLDVRNESSNSRIAYVDYIQITVGYSVAGVLNWYTASSGGTLLGSGSPFNPVGVAGSGLTDTNTPGIHTFYASCSIGNGCRTATTFEIKTPPAKPTITNLDPIEVCATASFAVRLESSSATGNQWYLGGTAIPGATNQLFTATELGNYTVIVTGANLCSSPVSDAVSIISTQPTITIATEASTCFDNVVPQTATLAYSGFTYSPVTYSITSATPFMVATNATLLSGSITITVPAGTAAGDYTGNLTVKNAVNCVSSGIDITITVKPLPDGSFSYSAAEYCGVLGSKTTPTITGLSGVFSADPITGLSINSGTGEIDLGATTPGIYKVINTVTDNGCTSADRKTHV